MYGRLKSGFGENFYSCVKSIKTVSEENKLAIDSVSLLV